MTFTAEVAGVDLFTTPTGYVTFFIDNKLEDIVKLDQNGKAIYSISTLPPVKHTIQAKYSGDSSFLDVVFHDFPRN